MLCKIWDIKLPNGFRLSKALLFLYAKLNSSWNRFPQGNHGLLLLLDTPREEGGKQRKLLPFSLLS